MFTVFQCLLWVAAKVFESSFSNMTFDDVLYCFFEVVLLCIYSFIAKIQQSESFEKKRKGRESLSRGTSGMLDFDPEQSNW